MTFPYPLSWRQAETHPLPRRRDEIRFRVARLRAYRRVIAEHPLTGAVNRAADAAHLDHLTVRLRREWRLYREAQTASCPARLNSLAEALEADTVAEILRRMETERP